MKSLYKIFFYLSLSICALYYLVSIPSYELDKKLNVWPDIAMTGSIREMRRSMIAHECFPIDSVTGSSVVLNGQSRDEIGAQEYCQQNYRFNRLDIGDTRVVAHFICDAKDFLLKYRITYMRKPDEDDRITLCEYSITPK